MGQEEIHPGNQIPHVRLPEGWLLDASDFMLPMCTPRATLVGVPFCPDCKLKNSLEEGIKCLQSMRESDQEQHHHNT